MPIYSWEELLARVEADPPFGDSYYILFRGGDPVAAALVPSMNPGLPEEILVGDTPGIIRKAERLLQCQHPVPFFVKLFENRWEYGGMYGNPRRIDDRATYEGNLQIRLAAHPDRPVAFAIRWERVGD